MIITTSAMMVYGAALGAVLGSFINAAEYRMARGQRIVVDPNGRMSRSACTVCRVTLTTLDLVPVISFLMLRGRCRHCTARIAWQYPIVELITAALFAVAAWRFGWSAQTVIAWVILAVLVFVFIYDLKYYLILDRVMIPAMVVVFFVSLLFNQRDAADMLLGAFIGGLFFLLQFLISQGRWIGGGDIRLGVFMGVALGWQSTIAALVIAYVLGALISVGLLAARRVTMQSHIPFGTFLSVAVAVCLLFGAQIIQWYTGLVL